MEAGILSRPETLPMETGRGTGAGPSTTRQETISSQKASQSGTFCYQVTFVLESFIIAEKSGA